MFVDHEDSVEVWEKKGSSRPGPSREKVSQGVKRFLMRGGKVKQLPAAPNPHWISAKPSPGARGLPVIKGEEENG